MTREPSIYETRTNLSGGVIKGTRTQVIRHCILTELFFSSFWGLHFFLCVQQVKSSCEGKERKYFENVSGTSQLRIIPFSYFCSRPGSSVGIATSYGLDDPGIESRWGRGFPYLSRAALGPTQPPIQWVLGLSRGYKAAGAWRWPLTPSSAEVEKQITAIPLLSLRAFVVCKRGETYLAASV
jgi:hypothetical protein